MEISRAANAVIEAVSKWQKFAAEVGVSDKDSEKVDAVISK